MRRGVLGAARHGGFFFAELKVNGGTLLRDVHLLARTYHWSQAEILSLSKQRRTDYIALIEAEHDEDLLRGVAGAFEIDG